MTELIIYIIQICNDFPECWSLERLLTPTFLNQPSDIRSWILKSEPLYQEEKKTNRTWLNIICHDTITFEQSTMKPTKYKYLRTPLNQRMPQKEWKTRNGIFKCYRLWKFFEPCYPKAECMHVQIISFNINGYKSKNVKLLSLHMDPFQTWHIILQSCLSNDFIHFFFAAQETEHACI